MRMRAFLVSCGSLLLTVGCATTDVGKSQSKPLRISQECPTAPSAPNARYVGPYLGVENNLSVDHLTTDIRCGEAFRNDKRFANGFVTIFGGSGVRERPTSEQCATAKDDTLKSYCKWCTEHRGACEKNNESYGQVRTFARDWTKAYGAEFPVMTPAGPGLMEAGSRGAMEAVNQLPGRFSVGYTTYYDRPTGEAKDLCKDGSGFKPYPGEEGKPYCGFPGAAFVKHPETGEELITDGLIFSSVVVREYLMLKHSAAILVGPGGTGTEWEIFQLIETLKSGQIREVPVYFIGSKSDPYWESLYRRLDEMESRNGISADAKKKILARVRHVTNLGDLLPEIRGRLKQVGPEVLFEKTLLKKHSCQRWGEEGEGDIFYGCSRRVAKVTLLPLDRFPEQSYVSIAALRQALTPDSDMMSKVESGDLSSDETLNRIPDEERNVGVPAEIIAVAYESDNDYHIIVGDKNCSNPDCLMNVEISALTRECDGCDLARVRSGFEKAFVESLGSLSSYKCFDPPVPVVVSGSVFYDGADHGPDEVGPNGRKPSTAWEIHPIREIRPVGPLTKVRACKSMDWAEE